MTRKPRTVAFVSRHLLLPEQQQNLIAAGFRSFVQVRPPDERLAETGGRFKTTDEVWRAICRACDGTPGLVVAVLPVVMLGQLAIHASHRRVRVLRARMVPKNGDWIWTGEWEEVTGFGLSLRRWKPQPESEGRS